MSASLLRMDGQPFAISIANGTGLCNLYITLCTALNNVITTTTYKPIAPGQSIAVNNTNSAIDPRGVIHFIAQAVSKEGMLGPSLYFDLELGSQSVVMLAPNASSYPFGPGTDKPVGAPAGSTVLQIPLPPVFTSVGGVDTAPASGAVYVPSSVAYVPAVHGAATYTARQMDALSAEAAAALQSQQNGGGILALPDDYVAVSKYNIGLYTDPSTFGIQDTVVKGPPCITVTCPPCNPSTIFIGYWIFHLILFIILIVLIALIVRSVVSG